MRLNRDDDGAIAILVAVLAIAMFMMAGIVVDLGYARNMHRRAQDVADAAVLAGAGTLKNCSGSATCGPSVAAVKASVLNNYPVAGGPPDWSSCSATSLPTDYTWRWWGSGTSCIRFGRLTSSPNPFATVVFVRLPTRHSPVFFGGLIGYGGVDVSARAIGGTRPTQGEPCALCVLGPVTSGTDITVNGGGSLYAHDADATTGAVTVNAGSIYVTDDPVGSNYNPAPRSTNENVVNPLAPCNGPPACPTAPTQPGPPPDTCDGTTPLTPDHYADLDVTGNCVMTPGVYEFSGELKVEGGASLTGPVALMFTDTGTLSVYGDFSNVGNLFTFAINVDGGAPVMRVGPAGSLLLDGALSAPTRQMISKGVVSISGTSVFDNLDVPEGSFVVSAPGSDVGLVGPHESALVQ